MSFSRLNYDDCTYKHTVRESIGPGDYVLGTPRVDCDGCFFPSPNVIMNHFGGAVCGKDLIDVDSELMGIRRKASNCPSDKFLPTDKPMCTPQFNKECHELTSEETRMSNPACTLRGTGWNRWEWLCKNPQDKALMPFDFLINNRLVVKDNHRPCVVDPMDQSEGLPPMENNFVRYDWSSRYTKPFYDVVSPQLATCGQ
jgi:hypothetical protein